MCHTSLWFLGDILIFKMLQYQQSKLPEQFSVLLQDFLQNYVGGFFFFMCLGFFGGIRPICQMIKASSQTEHLKGFVWHRCWSPLLCMWWMLKGCCRCDRLEHVVVVGEGTLGGWGTLHLMDLWNNWVHRLAGWVSLTCRKTALPLCISYLLVMISKSWSWRWMLFHATSLNSAFCWEHLVFSTSGKTVWKQVVSNNVVFGQCISEYTEDHLWLHHLCSPGLQWLWHKGFFFL